MIAPFVSVIIPTYNREKMLGITIDSFINQNYPKNKYEIIISNNNSTDETERLIKKYIEQSEVLIKYVFEKRQGVHYARNTAAKHAKGSVLYFTDDDMIADENLLKSLVTVFEYPYKVGTVTGVVLPKWEIDPPEWILKYCSNGWLSLKYKGSESLLISENDIGVYSCHQAILRDVFFKTGGFNPENTAGEWIGDGETGLNIKVKELGYLFGFTSKSKIYHMIPKERTTQKYLNKRLANQGSCESYTLFRKYKYTNWQLTKKIFHDRFTIIKVFFTYLRLRFFRKDSWHLRRAYCSYYLSRIKYFKRLKIDKTWVKMVLKENWLDD